MQPAETTGTYRAHASHTPMSAAYRCAAHPTRQKSAPNAATTTRSVGSRLRYISAAATFCPLYRDDRGGIDASLFRAKTRVILVEAAVETTESALAAERAGAGRVELCARLDEGGTTPGAGLIASVTTQIGIPVFVM